MYGLDQLSQCRDPHERENTHSIMPSRIVDSLAVGHFRLFSAHGLLVFAILDNHARDLPSYL